MLRKLAVLLSLTLPCCAQSINGIPNQSMSGFAPGVGGAPIIVSTNNYEGKTSTITNQIECSTTNCPLGTYELDLTLTPVTTATTGTISLSVSFTGPGGLQTPTAISALSLTTTAPSSVVYIFRSTGATNVLWSTTVASILGSYSYNVYPTIKRLSPPGS